jgi:hypothetical protein
MRKLYALFGILVIAGYSFAAVTGYELRTSKRKFVPQGVRGKQSSGGAVYYGGYRGGK